MLLQPQVKRQRTSALGLGYMAWEKHRNFDSPLFCECAVARMYLLQGLDLLSVGGAVHQIALVLHQKDINKGIGFRVRKPPQLCPVRWMHADPTATSIGSLICSSVTPSL